MSSIHRAARAIAIGMLISCGPSRSAPQLSTKTAAPADAARPMLGSVVTTLTVSEDKEPAFLAWAKTRLAEINAREKGAVIAVLAAAQAPRTYVWIERGDRARTDNSASKLQEWASAPPQTMQLTDVVTAVDRHDVGDAKAITLLVKMPMKPQYEQTFLATATEFIPLVRDKEPYTLLYSVSAHPTEPHTYVWVERFRDKASADTHEATPYLQALLPKLPEWLAGEVDGQELTQVSPP